MTDIVDAATWLTAQRKLLAAEKALQTERDQLALAYPMDWVRRHDEY